MVDQNLELEQEINLREYIDVIVKRKKLIIAIFFVSIVATAVISFITPKVYEVSMVIEVPTLGVTDTGNPIFIDSPDNIKAKIGEGIFNLSVVNALKLDPQKTRIELKVSEPQDLTLLRLSINEPENEKELGAKILNQFFNELVDFYKNSVQTKKDDIDKQISLISNRIKDENDSIKLNEENFKILESREKEVTNEVKNIKVNTEKLLAKRDTLLEKRVQADDVESLLYSNAIQQNIVYVAQLNNQLAYLDIKKDSTVNDIKSLQDEIAKLNIEMQQLKTKQEAIRNVNLIQEPQALLTPSPSKKKNIVLAGILSLMAGTFLAFFMEFLEKTKRA